MVIFVRVPYHVGVPFSVIFIRAPYHIRDLKRGPNSENCPYMGA